MLNTHEKFIGRNKGKSKWSKAPEAGHSGIFSRFGHLRDESDTSIDMPEAQSIRDTSKVESALDIPEELESTLTKSTGVIEKTSADRFLQNLGRILHNACRKMEEGESNKVLPRYKIVTFCSRALINLPAADRREIKIEYYVNALSHIPMYLFAQKDPDHPGDADIPNIKELLALEAYVAEYEEKGDPDAGISGYHRGKGGQPDFVLEKKPGVAMKKFDPLQLPRGDNVEHSKTWLKGAYDHHAGGKNTGAVCILDVSDATGTQLDNWIKIFGYNSVKIRSSLENQKDQSQIEDELIHLCNTYVVSYGRNAENDKVKALQTIFDETRKFLREHPELMQLEKWRENEMNSGPFPEAPVSGGIFDGLFDFP